ncbi:hypothetical protein [Blastococcus sp. LR1]|uniref:hypothetical protein n=1 Tax=Blastococcus sp. LR1 TaxID=2877000 RepID=UPI001CCBE0B1|nr:hypothetical protein [Blastococcus sp. LR1]MCA0145398.1 hypothetical protein [Blastococcus sp. LR1]
MPTRPPSSRVLAAVVTGAATTLHYASPDVITDRRTRGWAKVAITGVALIASVPEVRATWSSDRQAPDGEASLAELFRSMPTSRKAVALTPVVAVVGAMVGWLAFMERLIFRRGQRRAAAGKRLPHTGPALVYGFLAGLLWFLSPPDDRR